MKKRTIIMLIVLASTILTTGYREIEDEEAGIRHVWPEYDQTYTMTFVDTRDDYITRWAMPHNTIVYINDPSGEIHREFAVRQDTRIELPEYNPGRGYIFNNWDTKVQGRALVFDPVYKIVIGLSETGGVPGIVYNEIVRFPGHKIMVYNVFGTSYETSTINAPTTFNIRADVPQGYSLVAWEIEGIYTDNNGEIRWAANPDFTIIYPVIETILYFTDNQGNEIFAIQRPREDSIILADMNFNEIQAYNFMETQKISIMPGYVEGHEFERWSTTYHQEKLYIVPIMRAIQQNSEGNNYHVPGVVSSGAEPQRQTNIASIRISDEMLEILIKWVAPAIIFLLIAIPVFIVQKNKRNKQKVQKELARRGK